MIDRCWAVVPAAGVGARVGAGIPKQYLSIAGRTVIEHTLAGLLAHPEIVRIAVPVSVEDGWWPSLACARDPRVIATQGGRERCHSVLAGLNALAAEASENDWVLVHDAARPCVPHDDVRKLLALREAHPVGGLLAVPVADTLKSVVQHEVLGTVDRSRLWRALTPQMFRYGLLRDALNSALAAGTVVTDESHAVELVGQVPAVVEGSARNLKITRPEDLPLAEFYLKQVSCV